MPVQLSLDDHLTVLRDSGAVLREAAVRAGLDAPVPTCPTWDVRALLGHQGMVHRWAAANLRGERDHGTEDSIAEAAAAPDLLEWFTAGLGALVKTIEDTPDDAEAMVFLKDAPPPRRFWTRRQAHETTIHSADAVAAVLGRWPVAADLSISPKTAADGIDELLCGFITRGKSRLTPAHPLTIVVSTSDTGHAWTVRVAESLTTATGVAGDPDVTLSGTAAQLYLGLWNRSDEITEHGRTDLLDLWREQVQIHWRG